jgi:16S rRNA (cytidine1402-2'-O)-methyltransferase
MGELFVVATPIGNLEDLSPRALRILKSVDLIACEDTRHTRKLLTHFGIKTPTTSYHEHNEAQKARSLLDKLQQGDSIALVSDAGTPLLSDPGFRLVRGCRDAGLPVRPIPGPFAGAAALSIAGLPSDRFLFAGFPPTRVSVFERELEGLSLIGASLVFYLSPHRAAKNLETILKVLGNRAALLVREMTKLHETSYHGNLESILETISEEKPRGEYTLVVQGAAAGPEGGIVIDVAAYVEGLVTTRGLAKKAAIKQAAKELGISRREVYGAVIDS